MEHAASGGAPTESTSWWRRRADLVAVLALVIASFVFVGEQVSEHEMMSPIDEYQYVGYYAVVADHGIVRRGEPMPVYARRYMSCHGVRNIPEMPVNEQGCKRPNSVGYPIEGGTTADLYTPLYFGATRALAQPLLWMGVDFVSAGRAVGGFWLALGAVFLYLALRRRRVPTPVATGLGLVLIGSISAYWGNTYISTDATALTAGGLAALLTVRALDGVRWSLVLLPAAAVLATLFKLQNLIAFGAAAVVLLLVAGLDAGQAGGPVGARLRRLATDRRVFSAVAVVVASVGAQGCWLAIRSALAVGDQPSFGIGAPLRVENLIFELGNFLPNIGGGALSPFATGVKSVTVYALATALAIGGAVGLTLSKGIPARERAIGMSTVLVAVLSAPFLALVVGVMEQVYVQLAPRYGTSLLPWALLSAGLLIEARRAWVRWAFLGLCTASWGLSLMMGEA
jgi:hypothetical protein